MGGRGEGYEGSQANHAWGQDLQVRVVGSELRVRTQKVKGCGCMVEIGVKVRLMGKAFEV